MSNPLDDFLFKLVYLKTSFKKFVHEFVDMRNANNGAHMRNIGMQKFGLLFREMLINRISSFLCVDKFRKSQKFPQTHHDTADPTRPFRPTQTTSNHKTTVRYSPPSSPSLYRSPPLNHTGDLRSEYRNFLAISFSSGSGGEQNYLDFFPLLFNNLLVLMVHHIKPRNFEQPRLSAEISQHLVWWTKFLRTRFNELYNFYEWSFYKFLTNKKSTFLIS